MKTLVIRADADSRIGTGHVMRCLALAQEWRQAGGEVGFISRCDRPAVADQVRRNSDQQFFLPESCPDLDLRVTEEYAGRWQADWLVLDGYQLRHPVCATATTRRYRVLAIDDYHHLPQYTTDGLLNQNVGADAIPYHRPPHALTLLGPRYSLLRPEFCSGVTAPRIAPPVARNILITFGGSDPRNVTAKVLRILAEKPRLPLHFKVIAGAANPHLPELRTLAAAAPELMELLPNAANMAELMRWADLAVTAGGSTCLEGLATGLPMLVLVTAGNQQRVAEHLGRSGLAVNLGWYDACEPDFLCDRFLSLCRNQPQRALLGANGPATVDGHGVGRTVRHLLETPVWLRHVHASDARLLWTWANDPPVRAASFHPAPIPWEEHLAWLDRRLGDPRTLFLLALSGEDRPVGQVRFDFSDRESVLSVSIARDFRGCGLGVPVLQAACRRVFSGNPAVQVVRALIRPENTTSLHTFAKAGFVPDGDTCVNGIKARTFLLRRKEYP